MNYLFIVKIVIGIWLIISSFVLGFSEVGPARWNNIIIGLILVALLVLEFSNKNKSIPTTDKQEGFDNHSAPHA